MSSFPPPDERPTSPPPWPPPPRPDAGDGGGEGRRGVPQGLLLALSALLGAAVVLVGLLAWIGTDDGDGTSAGPTTSPPTTAPDTAPTTPPPTTGPPTTEPPGTAPPPDEVVPLACPAEVPAAICEAADYVQRETGRAFRQFPDVELVDDDEFRSRLLAMAEEDLPEVEAFGRTLVAVGLVDPGLDVVAALRELFAVGVVGFYEPTDDVLVVRGTDATPYTRIVIVHELVHALDDQWFDIDRPQYEDDGELAFGFSALVEGHASVIDERYRSSLSPDEQEQAAAEELRLLLESGVDVAAIPRVLIEMLSAPYLLGAPLVERILDEGGHQALAQAFEAPPATSEQVLHPELYSEGEPAVAVPAPPAGGEVVDEAVMGEYGIALWLSGDGTAAAGWGGDRYVTWQDGERWCTRMDLVLDTQDDRAEARAAFARWATGGPDRTVADAAVGPDPGLRVTACS